MRKSALYGVKNFGYFKIYGVSTRTREFEPVWTFCRQEGGVNFSKFIADVFYGWPLIYL